MKSGHTYTEYQEAKNLYRAIVEKLLPLEKRKITEAWLKETNGIIRGMESEYRKNPVYIGTIVEDVYYPLGPDKVPDLMKELFYAKASWNL